MIPILFIVVITNVIGHDAVHGSRTIVKDLWTETHNFRGGFVEQKEDSVSDVLDRSYTKQSITCGDAVRDICGVCGGDNTTCLELLHVRDDPQGEEKTRSYVETYALYALVLVACLLLLCTSCSVAALTISRYQVATLKSTLEARNEALREKEEELEERDRDLHLMSNAWVLNWNDVELKERLAEGGYGEVWKGTYRGQLSCAVKKMFNTDNTSSLDDESEIRFLQRIRHPRLVTFMGAGRIPSERNLFVVLEFMELGSLHALIQKHSGQPQFRSFLWTVRMRILVDITEGMAFLHDKLDSIHRDLKSANVLLSAEDGEMRAKVSDFGTSRFAARDKTRKRDNSMLTLYTSNDVDRLLNGSEKTCSIMATTQCGTATHMAPEMWSIMKKSRGRVTNRVDVFSFGIIMWEVMTLQEPWMEIRPFFGHKVADAVMRGVRPRYESGSRCDVTYEDADGTGPVTGYVNLMEACWATDPTNRPGFQTLRETFRLKQVPFLESAHARAQQRRRIKKPTLPPRPCPRPLVNLTACRHQGPPNGIRVMI